MKIFFKMLFFHLKRELSSIKFVSTIILLPVGILLLSYFLNNDVSVSENTLSIVSESSYFDNEIKGKLNIYFKDAIRNNLEEEKVRLNKNIVKLIAYIPKDFETTHKIEYISNGGENVEKMLSESVNAIIKTNDSKNKINSFNNDDAQKRIEEINKISFIKIEDSNEIKPSMFLFLRLYYIMFSIIMLIVDYTDILTKGIDKRTQLSPVSKGISKSSLLASYGVITIVVYTLIGILESIYLNKPIEAMGTILLAHILVILYSLSLLLFFVKYIKPKALQITIPLITVVILFFLPIVGERNQSIAKFQYISPIYWIMNLVLENKLFPSVLIIISMSIVLILASLIDTEVET